MTNTYIFKKNMIIRNMKDIFKYRLWLHYTELDYIVYNEQYLLPKPPHHSAPFLFPKNLVSCHFLTEQQLDESKRGKSFQSILQQKIRIYWRKYIFPTRSQLESKIINYQPNLIDKIACQGSSQILSQKQEKFDQHKRSIMADLIREREEHNLKYRIPQKLLDNVTSKQFIEQSLCRYDAIQYFNKQSKQFDLVKLKDDLQNGKISLDQAAFIQKQAADFRSNEKARVFLKLKNLSEAQFQKIYRISVDFSKLYLNEKQKCNNNNKKKKKLASVKSQGSDASEAEFQQSIDDIEQ